MLKCKLHGACVTRSELHYDGSCAIDGVLLDKAGILEYQQIHIYNINNGARFATYAIRAEEGSCTISANGAAARLACPGDRLIICAYTEIEAREAQGFKPKLLYLKSTNRIKAVRDHIPIQAQFRPNFRQSEQTLGLPG